MLVVAASLILPVTVLPIPAYAAVFESNQTPATMRAGTVYTIPVRIRNAGRQTWQHAGANPVHLSYHWQDSNGTISVYDGLRTALAADVIYGSYDEVNARVLAPPNPGSYTLVWDMVREGFFWFANQGSLPWEVRVTVVGT